MIGSKNAGLRGVLAMALGLAANAQSAFDGLSLPRTAAPSRTKTRGAFPYTDKAGLSHGRTGDKLARKAANGTIGLRNRGPYAAWHLYPKAR